MDCENLLDVVKGLIPKDIFLLYYLMCQIGWGLCKQIQWLSLIFSKFPSNNESRFSKKEWVIFSKAFSLKAVSTRGAKLWLLSHLRDQTYFGQLQTYFWQVLSRKVCTSFFLSVLSQHRVHRWGYTALLLQKIFGFKSQSISYGLIFKNSK